ncbi:MAG: hypothetical protein QME12_00050 [Nanoarchaeota archaeon]|nr:hypothetical protein [Nanoarchaeota archaeon]
MAIKKKPREKPDESIHVRLDNPTLIRKENLSLAIDIIGLLKRYYEYLEIKKQKDGLMRLLRADIAEIKRLTKELVVEEMPVSMNKILSAEQKTEAIAQKGELPPLEPKEEKKKEAPKPAKPQLPKPASKPKDKLETELEELKNMISKM